MASNSLWNSVASHVQSGIAAGKGLVVIERGVGAEVVAPVIAEGLH